MTSPQIYIYPTDTVWGIGCDIYSEEGVKEISRIKKSSENKPLSIMFTDLANMFEYVNFPSQFSKNWLRIFFSLETTLVVPKIWLKKALPVWCSYESDYISLRYSEDEALKNLEKKIGNPFFTTSLNEHGMPAITLLDDAQMFIKKHCPTATLISSSGLPMSGKSSSIVFIEKNLKYDIKRAGEKILEIKNHLELLCLD